MRIAPRALALAAAALLLAGGLRADQFEQALAAARANLTTVDGRDYDRRIGARLDEKHDALRACAASAKPEDLVPFTVVIQMSAAGHAEQVLLRPPTPVAICLRWSIRETAFPRPPKSSWWVYARFDPGDFAPAVTPSPAETPVTETTPSARILPVLSPTSAPSPRPSPRPTATPPPPAAAAPIPTAVPTKAAAGRGVGPIIDVHVDAFADGRLPGKGPEEEALRRATLEALSAHGVAKAVVCGIGPGSLESLTRFRDAAPGLVIASLGFHGDDRRPDPADLRRAVQEGKIGAIGPILAQLDGMSPDDPRLEPYWGLAEELDVPVGIPMGPGPPGTGAAPDARYRVSAGDPLLLENVFARHPRLRVDVMRAGWPMADAMVGLLWTYPRVYVDTGMIAWALDRREFHAYLRRLTEAGFGDRILFASEQGNDSGRIAEAIDAIESADFLTAPQKRAILHDNAERFLRLEGGPTAKPVGKRGRLGGTMTSAATVARAGEGEPRR